MTRAEKMVHIVRESLRAIILNDKTRYEHHQYRPSDGMKPREVGGGTIFLTPKEIAEGALRELDALASPHSTEERTGAVYSSPGYSVAAGNTAATWDLDPRDPQVGAPSPSPRQEPAPSPPEREEECPTCEGRKRFATKSGPSDCITCNGTGRCPATRDEGGGAP